jgi:hypothetical protein
MKRVRLAVAVLFVAAFACGPVDLAGRAADGGSGSASPPAGPAIVVVSPMQGQDFEFEDEDDDHHGDDRFGIEVEVENAELAERGRCRGGGSCGHLVLLIDGNACGNPNSSSSSASFEGQFGRCLKVSGQHQIVVQLVDDAGNVLAASAPITVNVTLKGRGGDHGDHGGDDGEGHG